MAVFAAMSLLHTSASIQRLAVPDDMTAKYLETLCTAVHITTHVHFLQLQTSAAARAVAGASHITKPPTPKNKQGSGAENSSTHNKWLVIKGGGIHDVHSTTCMLDMTSR